MTNEEILQSLNEKIAKTSESLMYLNQCKLHFKTFTNMKMTEPNYKEFADRFYNLLKENHFYRGLPAFNEVVKEYENATKPKLKFISYYNFEKFVYDNRDYALIDGFWYRVQKCVLTLVENNNLKSELIDAYYEWEKNK